MPKGLVQSITILPARPQAFHGRLGRGPGRRDYHDLGLFDGFGRRFDALLGQRRIFRIGGIA
jgi:hypothetical protein